MDNLEARALCEEIAYMSGYADALEEIREERKEVNNMQAIAQDVVEKNGLKEFEELMREVAELPAEQRGTVAVFSQGVLALAQLQQRAKKWK